MASSSTVFSTAREIAAPVWTGMAGAAVPNAANVMDGLDLLGAIPGDMVPAVFLDPQYRGVLDRMKYGNEGQARGRARSRLPQMDEDTIRSFIREIDRVLMPQGHLFLWVDKYHLCAGIQPWREGTDLSLVDMVTWHKQRLGMGYRTRRASEHLIIMQKEPRRAKGVWKVHNIPDVWPERVSTAAHPHAKPVGLQQRLIEAVTHEGDLVVDPAAGSYTVLAACQACGRVFLGCDLNDILL